MSNQHLTIPNSILWTVRCALWDFNIKISSTSITGSMHANKTNRFYLDQKNNTHKSSSFLNNSYVSHSLNLSLFNMIYNTCSQFSFSFGAKKTDKSVRWHLLWTSWERRDIFYSIAYMHPAWRCFCISSLMHISTLDIHNTHLFDSDLFVPHIVRVVVFFSLRIYFLGFSFSLSQTLFVTCMCRACSCKCVCECGCNVGSTCSYLVCWHALPTVNGGTPFECR